MEPSMSRRVCGRIRRHMVQARCAESSYGTIGHCFAPSDRPVIFEIEHNIRFRGGMKAFGIPSCRNQTLLANIQTAESHELRDGKGNTHRFS